MKLDEKNTIIVNELKKCIIWYKDPSSILEKIQLKNLESVFRILGRAQMRKIFELCRNANCQKPHLLESFYEVII